MKTEWKTKKYFYDSTFLSGIQILLQWVFRALKGLQESITRETYLLSQHGHALEELHSTTHSLNGQGPMLQVKTENSYRTYYDLDQDLLLQF